MRGDVDGEDLDWKTVAGRVREIADDLAMRAAQGTILSSAGTKAARMQAEADALAACARELEAAREDARRVVILAPRIGVAETFAKQVGIPPRRRLIVATDARPLRGESLGGLPVLRLYGWDHHARAHEVAEGLVIAQRCNDRGPRQCMPAA